MEAFWYSGPSESEVRHQNEAQMKHVDAKSGPKISFGVALGVFLECAV